MLTASIFYNIAQCTLFRFWIMLFFVEIVVYLKADGQYFVMKLRCIKITHQCIKLPFECIKLPSWEGNLIQVGDIFKLEIKQISTKIICLKCCVVLCKKSDFNININDDICTHVLSFCTKKCQNCIKLPSFALSFLFIGCAFLI